MKINALPSEFFVASEAEMRRVGSLIAMSLKSGDVVCLQGALGVGKTFLARAISEALGVDPGQIHSPSFGLVHQYHGRNFNIFHCDFDRLKRFEQLEDLGGVEFFGEDALYLIEWPERIAPVIDSLRSTVYRIKITISNSARLVQIIA